MSVFKVLVTSWDEHLDDSPLDSELQDDDDAKLFLNNDNFFKVQM